KSGATAPTSGDFAMWMPLTQSEQTCLYVRGPAYVNRSTLGTVDTQTPSDPREHHLTAMLRTHLTRIEHMVTGEHRIQPDQFHCPGWLRKTAGEPRLPVSLAIMVAIVLQALLPERYVIKPQLLLPGLELALLAALVIANPHRICRES